jgi:hypothetical protein
MGKVFVHHPLKRAELKRLTNPPPPPEPVTVHFPPERVISPEERECRALVRAIERRRREAEDAEFRDNVASVQAAFRLCLVKGEKFSMWIYSRSAQDRMMKEALTDDTIPSLLVDMLAPGPDRFCLRCGAQCCQKVFTGNAGMLFPLISGYDKGTVLSFIVCNSCVKLGEKSIKYLATMELISAAMKSTSPDSIIPANKIIRRTHLEALDVMFLVESHYRHDAGMCEALTDYASTLDGFLGTDKWMFEKDQSQ